MCQPLVLPHDSIPLTPDRHNPFHPLSLRNREVTEVLIACPDARFASELGRRLTGVALNSVLAPDAAFDGADSADLLILDDTFAEGTVEFLARLRAAFPDLPVI